MPRARLSLLPLLAPVLLAACSVMVDPSDLAPKGSGGDRTPPTAALAVPGEDATGVAVEASLTIAFSEPMNVGSVTVATQPSISLGVPVWSPGNQTVSFAPAGLAPQTDYVVNVGGADVVGNAMTPAVFHFRTLDVPPSVLATTPPDNATSVAVNTAIQFSFSEAMNQSSVQSALSSTPAISCTWSWPTATTARCTPQSNLAYNQAFTVTLGTSAWDADGAALTTSVSFDFTTAAAPHVLAPSVVSSTPDSGATGAARYTNISITFNEPVDKATAEAAFGIVSPAGYGGGALTWSGDGLTMTYDPPTDFPYGTVVTWRMGTGLKCLGGVNLAVQVQRSFTVIFAGTATIYGLPSMDGWMYNTDTSVKSSNTTLFMGDSSASGNPYARAFLGFDLSSLPGTLTSITGATLYVYGTEFMSGDPFGGLGDLLAQSVDFGATLTTADFDTPVLTYFGYRCSNLCTPVCHLVCFSGTWNDEYTLATGAVAYQFLSTDVTGKVQRDWTARAARTYRSHFRLKFVSDTDSDGLSDNWGIHAAEAGGGTGPKLVITYESPYP